ncbi:AlpA family phage regulatory protein [Bradyrhizobium sp. 38]|nr:MULTISPECIES: AlpA family phage regulatory protein [unclassified Bradyrhizobium]MCK1337331.1 AlpA family phage regulatory protein [Bradyrhizobium sp. 38]MCK1777450.1 AlpA family phage regulatory protein [Bradyrhizobium sp. 132]
MLLLKLADVTKATGLGRSTVYRKISENTFPKPLQLGPGCVRWDADHLQAWRDSLQVANDNKAGEVAAQRHEHGGRPYLDARLLDS